MKFLKQYWQLLLLLLLLIILRIPNFFEPYWYGDEGIYLTLGNALRDGAKLYTDIIDHKTPFIYLLAMVPHQFWFRLLTLFWTLLTISFFYFFVAKLFKQKFAAPLATLILLVFTTLPWFEGNIPNGELFVVGFVTAGAYLLTKTHYFTYLLDSVPKSRSSVREAGLLLTVGSLFGLGVLTKVPALLDLAGFLFIGWMVVVRKFLKRRKLSQWWRQVKTTIKETSLLFIGALIPIFISVVIFSAAGSGRDYLDFGLLYNLSYAQSWQLQLKPEFLNWFFTLEGKLLLLTVFLLWVSVTKSLTRRFKFIAGWFSLTLFATLLSNRPYPHYFIQLMPALALLVTELIIIEKDPLGKTVVTLIRQRKLGKIKLNSKIINLPATMAILLLIVFLKVLSLLKAGLYPTLSYYQNSYRYLLGKLSKEAYYQTFNPLMKDNYRAAQIINQTTSKRIFIWGTNPMLYAMTGTYPTGRFTVAFHIKDFQAFDETYQNLVEQQPKIIVVMKDEAGSFPRLQAYLKQYYLPNYQFDHFILYLRNHNWRNQSL